MRADYDSQADALSIILVDVEHWSHEEQVDDDHCSVAFAGGEPAHVELLYPSDHLDLLDAAARRYGLDHEALIAAAQAALAAPDRSVVLDVHARAAA